MTLTATNALSAQKKTENDRIQTLLGALVGAIMHTLYIF